MTLEIFQTMRSHVYVYIGGDFNIDLLKINQKHHYNAFYENLVTAGYLPRITLPTRITDHSATLLDNIFTNVLEEHTSGVIVNNISDHQMIYTYKNVEIQHTRSCTNRYIEIERKDHHSIQNFLTKFQDFNLQNKLDMSENADSNENFNLFMQTFSTLKEKYLPKRRVKFNKRKHRKNPWLTQGLLNSINAKDKLYKLLLQTPTDSPNYQQLKTNVKTYRNIIRRTIIHAKRDYYRKTFNQFSDNIRKTWQIINDTLNRKRRSKDFPLEFILSNGKIISDHKQLANELNDFFQ